MVGNSGTLSKIRRVPMNNKYLVRLSEEERGVCQQLIKQLTGSSQELRRAQLLLKADADGPGWLHIKSAEAFNGRVQTLAPVRHRLVPEGCALARPGQQ